MSASKSRWVQHGGVLALPTLAALVSGVQLATQFREDFGLIEGRSIGRFTKTEGEVLKRSSRSFRWYSVSSSEQMVEKSSIKTSEQSQVRLNFKDGSTLDLGPQAFVVLGAASEGVPHLKVVRGNVEYKSQGRMLIEAGGKTFESQKSSGQVAVIHGSTQATLNSGTATLVDQSQKFTLSSGSSAKVSVDGVLTAKGAKIEDLRATTSPKSAPLRTPTPAADPSPVADPSPTRSVAQKSGDLEVLPYKINGSGKVSTRLGGNRSMGAVRVEIAWLPVEGARSYAVEFFDKKGKVVSRTPSSEPRIVHEVKRVVDFERSYRILAKRDDRELKSEILKYSIELAAPIPVNPANGARVQGGLFTWESTVLTESYEVQESQNRKFSQPEVRTSAVNFLNIRTNEKGPRFWRVRARVGDRWSPWSEIREFSVR